MEKLIKTIMVILFATLLILLCLMTFSCASKKNVDKHKEKTERKEVRTVSELETQKETKKENEFFFNFRGKIADNKKPGRITREEKDGKTIWNFENFDEIGGEDGKKETETESETEKKTDTTEEIDDKKDLKTVHREKKPDWRIQIASFFLVIGIIIWIISQIIKQLKKRIL